MASAGNGTTNGTSGKNRTTRRVVDPDKARKFREIGEPRVNRALKAIKLLGNLNNKSVYDPSPEDVARMIKALRNEVTELEERFSKGKKKTGTFSFSQGTS